MSAPRALAIVALLVLGVLALPLLATFLDGPSTENLVLPLDLALTAVVGALVWRVVPTPPDRPAVPSWRPFVIGAVVGLAAAAVGIVVFFLLISGLDGA